MRGPLGSLVAAAAGLALLTAAAFAGPQASTLRLAFVTDVDYVDPALAHYGPSWMVEYATCAKLYNYPDAAGRAGAQLRPEVATGWPKVSADGLTHTFELAKTFRFHTGELVTARSFARALERNANPKMQAPASRFMGEIEGVEAMLAKRAKSLSGVHVRGPYTLEIRTTRPLPDLVARLAMPFFCPVAPGTRLEPEGVNDPPGSGPYYVAERRPNRHLLLRRNPYYRGSRPRRVDRIEMAIGINQDRCLAMTERDEVDYCADGLTPTDYAALAAKYGVNRGRLFVHPTNTVVFYALNTDRPAFKNNPWLRRAINYAVDRPSLVRTSGHLGARRTDQILPPALAAGADVYPLQGPDLAKARALARGHLPADRRLILYAGNRTSQLARADVLRYQLQEIGLDVELRQFVRGNHFDKCETRGEPFDLCERTWTADYLDAGSYLRPLFDGTTIEATENTNTSYLDDPRVNARIVRIDRMPFGAARARAWAKLDVDVMRQQAPVIAFQVVNQRDFVSRSFGCYLYHPVYGVDLAAACKK